jgi:hypothetical protein
VQDKDLFPTGPLELPGESAQPGPVKRSRRINRKWLVVIFVSLIISVGSGFAVWKLLLQDNTPKPIVQIEPSPSSNTSARTDDDVSTSAERKSFKSDHPRVSFSYPANWTVSEADTGIRIVSPDFTYKTTDGKSVTGHFRVYIRQGARPVDSPYIGSGIAIKPSEILTYAEPAPGQRSETNLTHFAYDAPDHFAYFFIAGNYSLAANETLGPDYGKEPETYLIAGGYSSSELTDDLSMQRVPLDYYQSTNAYSQALEIMKSLKVL